MAGIRTAGTGRYLPRRRLLSSEINARLGWTKGEIEATSSMMGAAAAKQGLDAAGIAPKELDLIIGAGEVMEQAIPSTATLLESRLRLGRSGIAGARSWCC